MYWWNPMCLDGKSSSMYGDGKSSLRAWTLMKQLCVSATDHHNAEDVRWHFGLGQPRRWAWWARNSVDCLETEADNSEDSQWSCRRVRTTRPDCGSGHQWPNCGRCWHTRHRLSHAPDWFMSGSKRTHPVCPFASNLSKMFPSFSEMCRCVPEQLSAKGLGIGRSH